MFVGSYSCLVQFGKGGGKFVQVVGQVMVFEDFGVYGEKY